MRIINIMNNPKIESILNVMNDKNYVIFQDKRGHDLNIVGIRTKDVTANTFNDWIIVFYKFDGIWNFFAFPATTDPGIYYRQNPINVDGTAILVPGQYRGAYKVGMHKGELALQQKMPLKIYRDNNKDEILDFDLNEESGLYGINIHRANKNVSSIEVNKWSAGCQVFQDPDHFEFFMKLCRRGREKYGNSFTYTLLVEEDFN